MSHSKNFDSPLKSSPPGPRETKQANEPWKQPVKTEMYPGNLSPADWEVWQLAGSH